MILRKFLCYLLLIACLLPIGCSGSNKPLSNKVVIWHWMNDRKEAFDGLAKKYTQETGVEIEFKLFSPPDIYSQKVIAAARAGNLPEIFGILGKKKTLASFTKAGHALDLTAHMDENDKAWNNSFYPQALAVTAFKKNNSYDSPVGIYGVPIDITVMQFVYNKDLFEQSGYDPNVTPQTVSQLIEYAIKIKNTTGVDGFVSGFREGWLLNCLVTEWAINLMGEVKFLKTLQGEVPYTDDDWVKTFEVLSKLKNSGILSENITTMTNKEAEDAFSKDKAAFSFNGSWLINVYKQLNEDLNYGFFSLPKISKLNPVKVWGGAGSSFMVSSKSPNKNKAINFLKWLTTKEQQEYLIKATNNMPSIKGLDDKLSPILSSLVDDIDNLTHPNVWPINEDSRVIEIFNTTLQQLIMGLKTPLQAAREIQSVKEAITR